MSVWTISAEKGAGGPEIAAVLADAAGVPLLDRAALAPPDAFDDLDALEERFGGRLNRVALSLALNAGSAEAFRELRLRRGLPELGRTILAEAARRPCVILAPAAFAALPEHPAAVHVRLRAPLERRIDAVRREQLVDARCAEKAVRHDDHVMHAWVRTLYGVDVDDPARFSLVVDTSRFSTARIVETLLAAGGLGERWSEEHDRRAVG